MPPGAATRLFALLGDPVLHSRSPLVQNAAMAAAGVDAVYLALRCAAADVPGLMAGIARAGGGGNVTVPHKSVAAAAVEAPTAVVRRTGACNTFWHEDGRIHGDNTDVAGIAGAAAALVGELAGVRALLVGAGGAAAAALCALLDAGADHVSLLNRSEARAIELGRRLDPAGRRTSHADRSAIAGEAFDLVVNATSLGLHAGDALPLDLSTLRAGAALDLVYRDGGTDWTRHAHTLGVPARDGTEVLVLQGAAAFERWFRLPPPLAVMRGALAD
jgi:shikimate dehydrogenase